MSKDQRGVRQHSLLVLQVRPVLSGDREERLRAQGVPPSVIASMRSFEEQGLSGQRAAPRAPGPRDAQLQPAEPAQAQDLLPAIAQARTDTFDCAAGSRKEQDPSQALANSVAGQGPADCSIRSEGRGGSPPNGMDASQGLQQSSVLRAQMHDNLAQADSPGNGVDLSAAAVQERSDGSTGPPHMSKGTDASSVAQTDTELSSRESERTIGMPEDVGARTMSRDSAS